MAASTRILALIQTNRKLSRADWDALDGAISAWARKMTDASSRRWEDLLRDKQRAVYQFFKWVGKRPQQVTPADVAAWQEELRAQRNPQTRRLHYSPATIYSMVSKVSSFYRWAQKNAKRADFILQNPVDAVRLKAPRAYQTRSAKALTDEELLVLVNMVRAKADGSEVVGKRDYAMLLLYLVTGLRREEIAQLKWGEVKIEGEVLLLSVRVKGGICSRVKCAILERSRHFWITCAPVAG